jgi:phage terminase large subunit
MHCRAPEVLLSGPAGTGKSRGCLEKLHLMCLANPGMRGLIVRKVRDSLASTALATYRQHVAPEAIAAGIVHFYGGSAEEPPQYRYENGSAIMLGGMDKPTKIMSSEYDVAYAQEAIELTITDWENITTRLRNGKVSFQQLIADTNPDSPKHWLKQRCDRGTTKIIYCRHQDNPTLVGPDGTPTEQGAAYLRLLDGLTGVRRLRLRDGKWAAAEGIIYDAWDEDIHLVDRRPIPTNWQRYWTVDFGFTNPFVLQCWAVDPDGRLWLYREIYRTKTLVEDHAAAILDAVTDEHGRWTEPRPRAVICDHDAEDRATLERKLGMGTIAAHKSVSDGIQAVQARMRKAGDGRPRIFIMRDSLIGGPDPDLDEAKKPVCTAEELPGYVWAIKPGAGGDLKEAPAKINDHGADAMRYVVAELDLGGRPRIRTLG